MFCAYAVFRANLVPVPVLLAVFASLIFLTGVTVGATWIDLGVWNLGIAMGIATLKAALVALYFMHLRYDHPLNALIFLTGLVILALFLGLTLLDTLQYQPTVETWQESPQR
ncbi:MAG TPA: cytochrome C oxidase subunit IV family protein [Thermoguttaceae bacterium]|nr:cytochrome C oxidase subunit IV family protein [Thermoguttaceae bacterium]